MWKKQTSLIQQACQINKVFVEQDRVLSSFSEENWGLKEVNHSHCCIFNRMSNNFLLNLALNFKRGTTLLRLRVKFQMKFQSFICGEKIKQWAQPSWHWTPTSEEEDVWVLIFGNFVRALTWLHSQEADDVTHGLCARRPQISPSICCHLLHKTSIAWHFV